MGQTIRVEPGELVKDKIYFLCGYEAHVKPVPRIRALEFMGIKTSGDGEGDPEEYLFREYQKGMMDQCCSDEFLVSEDDLHLIKTFDEMMDWLASLRTSPGAEGIY